MDIGRICSELELLCDARANLERLKEEFHDKPELLAFYEPSAVYLVEQVARSVRESLESLLLPVDVDVWVELRGKAFDQGQGPAGVVGQFLRNLTVATKHALSILEGRDHGRGRFPRVVENLADFDVVAVATGSMRFGLRRPNPLSAGLVPIPKIDPAEITFQGVPEFDLAEEFRLKMAEAYQQTERAVKSFDLLMRVVASADDDSEFLALREELSVKELIGLLEHGRRITPSAASAIEQVQFVKQSGRNERYVNADINTSRQLRERADSLSKDTRYITGHGVIRQADVDKRELTIRSFSFSTPPYYSVREVNCRFICEITEDEIARTFNKAVAVGGWLSYSRSGDPALLEIDEYELDVPE